jgi:aryl-alcohol dehydrogenase-like predicted oxidoreductase
MQHTRLGRTGLKVSRICLGTMTFGLPCTEEMSHAILNRASEGGVTFLDTADAYPVGGDQTTSPIVGASRPEQLDATLAAVETPLPEDVLGRLDELTRDYRRGDSER